MRTSHNLTKMLCAFESLRTSAYWDGTYVDAARTQKRWSVGWGTTRYPDTDKLVREHDSCTEEQAAAWRDADIKAHAESVSGALFRIMPEWDADPARHQDKFDAVVDFAYNVGFGNFQDSTLRRLVDNGLASAADEFTKWTLAGGARSNGLLRRRLAERALFLSKFRPDGSLRTEKEDFPGVQWYPVP